MIFESLSPGIFKAGAVTLVDQSGCDTSDSLSILVSNLL